MADFNINHITGKQGQQGTVLAGITTVNSTGAMRFPNGPTSHRGGRGRAVFGGGQTPTDINTLNSNIAMLGFKVAVNGSLAKYSLVDQVIDEYTDTTGIDASASSTFGRSGTSGAWYYSGIVAGNYFGTGGDGDVTISSNTSLTVSNTIGSYDGYGTHPTDLGGDH